MLEQKKLDEFLQVINENLKELREKKKEVDQENKELYDAYMEGDVELYSSLMVSSTMQQMRVHWKRHILAESTIWIRRKGSSIASILESTELQKMQQIL